MLHWKCGLYTTRCEIFNSDLIFRLVKNIFTRIAIITTKPNNMNLKKGTFFMPDLDFFLNYLDGKFSDIPVLQTLFNLR